MIFKYINKKEWALIAVCFVLIVLQAFMELEIPGYMNQITYLLTTEGTIGEVMNEGWPMLGFAFGTLLLAIITVGLAAYVAASFAKRLRKMQFDNVASFSMKEINSFSPASLITRSTNDITQIQIAFVVGIQVLVKAPVIAILAILKISDKNPNWTYATIIAVVVMMSAIAIIMYLVIPRFRRIQRLTDNVNKITGEGLDGVRDIRAYNAEEYQESKFEKANEELTSTNLFTSRATSALMPTMTVIMNLLLLSIYIIGAVLISSSAVPNDRLLLFSDMVVFSAYAMMVVFAFIMMVIVLMILPRAGVAARRVEEVIETETSIKDGPLTASPEGREGDLEFRNVSFRYPGAAESVLEDINFKVEKGDTMAFIGSTGSGKSTLINLVLRFYDVTSGQVLVNGINVRDYELKTLHSKMGYVPQTATLFSGTVYDNVKYGEQSEDCTIEDVKKSISIAQGTDFVEKIEGGYEGSVSEGGTNLSGGQKQRLSIARAICKKPEFYIFDDSFSALDYKTDRILRKTLKKETSGVTNLIVAQRIGTIIDADTIVVLDKGRIAGIGKHDYLLKNCDVYHEIASSQLSEEELMR